MDFLTHHKIQIYFLDLREHQPLKQKNGFELYRIDGFILNEEEKV